MIVASPLTFHPTISTTPNNPQRKSLLTRILRLTLPCIMNKTPIRIRGKRASARTLHSTHNSNPKGKRPLSPTSRTSPPGVKLPRQNPTTLQPTACTRPLSYFERLPVELLEIILFYCLNPSLLQASTTISQKLDSTHVKSQLVLTILSSPNSFEYPCAASDVFPTLQERAKAQSAILRLPWMTLPFFRHLIPDFIVHTIIRELGARGIRWRGDGPMVTKESEPVIRQYLEDNAARFHHIGTKHIGLPAYWEIKWLEIPSKREIVLGIGLREGLVTLRERTDTFKDDWYREFDIAHEGPRFSRWRVFGGVEGCQIPKKLLRGPWTDEKCEFLELAIRGNGEVDRVNSTSGEVAEQGFWAAIEEHNARAVRALVTRIGPRGRPYDAEHTWYHTKPVGAPNQNFSAYQEDPIRKGVGIVPRQEHLRKTLEQGCPEEVLSALLGAAEVSFDLTTPDIQLWVSRGKKVGDRRAMMIQEELNRDRGWDIAPEYPY